MFHRHHFHNLIKRLQEEIRFIQVMSGPRQVGKSTLARQLCAALDSECILLSADEPALKPATWLQQEWEAARMKARNAEALLVLDEIQKLPYWSETVKRLWDEDRASETRLKVLLLGSSPLLLQQGLSESLAGRFELTHIGHWTYPEMQDAFGWDLETYLFFGGYPGSAGLIADETRWRQYILDSLIETSVSRDILLMKRVDKPALLRRLFQLSCEYSSQILSYQKMTGQLQDAGNTTTLAHYLDLLAGAGLVTGLMKYAGQQVRRRASSPKLQVMNTALMNAQAQHTLVDAQHNRALWGRITESAVGAHLINAMRPLRGNVYYWNERNREVDFVIELGSKIVALEVKSSSKLPNTSGMAHFQRAFHPHRILQVGGTGMPLEDFFTLPLEQLFQ